MELKLRWSYSNHNDWGKGICVLRKRCVTCSNFGSVDDDRCKHFERNNISSECSAPITKRNLSCSTLTISEKNKEQLSSLIDKVVASYLTESKIKNKIAINMIRDGRSCCDQQEGIEIQKMHKGAEIAKIELDKCLKAVVGNEYQFDKDILNCVGEGAKQLDSAIKKVNTLLKSLRMCADGDLQSRNKLKKSIMLALEESHNEHIKQLELWRFACMAELEMVV